MRTFVAAALACLSLIGLSHAGEVKASKKTISIPAQGLGPALQALSAERDVHVVFVSEDVTNRHTQPVSGNLTVDEVLLQLLSGTGLTYRYIDDTTISILPLAIPQSSMGSQSSVVPAPDDRVAALSGKLRLAQASEEPSKDPKQAAVEEIVVTAQKREERLQDVPVPVTALKTQSLVDSNQLRLQDYYTKVPGLNFTLLGNTSGPVISIRGMITGVANPAVAIVVDDVPFTSSASIANGGSGILAADFDPSELSRIEVLRGPQGTLYGAASLGGLLKYVTVDPSMDGVSGRLQVGTSTVSNGDDLGYSLRGAVNVPLGETFAIRASGSTRRDPGYVDNLQSRQEDLNRTDSDTARVAALWRPHDGLSLNLSALYQKSRRDGSADVHLPSPLGPRPDLGEFDQSALINTGWYEQKFQAYSATLTADVGHAELTSLSGYSINQLDEAFDQPTQAFRSLAQFGVNGYAAFTHSKTYKFTQELRLSTPLGERIDWLIGTFYTRERYPSHPDALAINPATGAVAGTWLHTDNTGSYSEYAAFTDVTFKITERFDVQVGGRESRNKLATGPRTDTGPLNTLVLLRADPAVSAKFESEEDAFTYLVTPRFKVSPDLMVYARLASGYRPGGPNTSPQALAAGYPAQYGHDTTQNYEVGMKGNAFGRMLSFDASVYYIDWQDVQLQLRDPVNVALQYTLNAGGAKSEGAELSLELRPLDGLTLAAWVAYNNAEFTDVPTTSVLTARSGDSLPYSARRSGTLSIDREFPLWSGASGFAGGSVSYVGDRKGRFFTGVAQGTFPSYTQLDLRAGVKLDSWSVNAYVNNVADKRGVLRAGRDSLNSALYAVTYIQPRTAGVSLTKSF